MPEVPLGNHWRGTGVLCRFGRPDPAASHRLHPAGRQLANPGACGTAARRHPGADARGGRARARADHPGAICEKRLHHHRRRRRRQRSVRAAGRLGGAQGHAHRAARFARGAHYQEAGDGATAARGASRSPRCAYQGGPGRLGREIHPRAHWRRPAGARQRGAGRGARPAHHPRHWQRGLYRSADPPGVFGYARLCSRSRSGRDHRGHRRGLAHRHHRRL